MPKRPNATAILQATPLPWRRDAQRGGRFRSIVGVVCAHRPSILDDDGLTTLWRLSGVPWLRPVENWDPRGHGRRGALRSLVDHLLVRYPPPAFLYGAMLGGATNARLARRITVFFAQVAAGHSPYAFLKHDLQPLQLTRRMCHAFMNSPAGLGFVPALRRAQVLGLGGDERLAQAVARSWLGDKITTHEYNWGPMLHWLCRQADLDIAEVASILDYLQHCLEQGYSHVEGRTLRALRRDMEEWHEVLAGRSPRCDRAFAPCGLKAGFWSRTRRFGDDVCGQTWTMYEILSSQKLLAESLAMRHCVARYEAAILIGDAAIWSLRCDGKRRLTVEFDREFRLITQARGRLNRSPRKEELELLHEWALENEIEVIAYLR